MMYNDINVPPLIRVDRIVSAFDNPIDSDKLQAYTEIMTAECLGHDFPAIKGYPHVIDHDDIGEFFLNGEEITRDHLDQIAWFVTDGHHRSIAAIEANLPHLEVELDYACIADQKQLAQWDKDS